MQTQRKFWNLMKWLTGMLLALSLCNPVAAAFSWRDDPFSFPAPDGTTPIRSGNSVTFGFVAVNGSPFMLPDLGVIVPWVFPVLSGTPVSMAWSNGQDGWVNANVDGTTLLVTLDNISGRLRFGDVADGSGVSPLDPTRSTGGVLETRLPDDLVPFFDLGSFGPNEFKPFDMTFTYHFGDDRQLEGQAPVTIGFLNTVSPVPEPATLPLFGIALLGLLRSRARKIA